MEGLQEQLLRLNLWAKARHLVEVGRGSLERESGPQCSTCVFHIL